MFTAAGRIGQRQMNEVNKTPYIPLYGKSYVSKRGMILSDKTAEFIWEKEGFELKGKSGSKWLAYYMGMRAAVFDEWTASALKEMPESLVLHIGCGMDSRVKRIAPKGIKWYDVDFPDVIQERKKYYEESEAYHMIGADARQTEWLADIEKKPAVVVMEGLSMYLSYTEMTGLLYALHNHFPALKILMDCYSEFAAKASKYKNPVKDMGVTRVYGIDDPLKYEDGTGVKYTAQHSITPQKLLDELRSWEKIFFSLIYCGKAARNMYHLYEYQG